MALQSSSYHKTAIKYNDGLRRIFTSAIIFLYQKGRENVDDKIQNVYIMNVLIKFCPIVS